MNSSYNIILIMASYAIAVVASFTALELVGRVLSTTGRASRLWLWAGSLVMGIGIWTMHFVGMLAFEMDMEIHYDVPKTVFSLGVAVAVSWFAIYTTSHASNNILTIVAAGVLLGLGIAAMHYTGMAAMEMNAVVKYDPVIFSLSIVIAIGAAIAALWIVFFISSSESEHINILKFAAALIMGFAVCGMHYTGMAAAIYEPVIDIAVIEGAVSTRWLAAVVIVTAILLLGITHLTIFFDYKLGEQKKFGDKLQKMVDERTLELMSQTESLKKSKEKIEKEIVERKNAENEAVYLSTLLDHSINEIYVFDSETLQYSHVNKGACTNLGIDKDKLLSMSPCDFLPESAQEEFHQILNELKENKHAHHTFESFHTRVDGTVYPVGINLQISKVMETVVFFAIVQDESKRKDLEAKLNRAQKLESIGQLAAGVAHEINTPTQFVGDNIRFLKGSFEDLHLVLEKYDLAIEELVSGAEIELVSAKVKEAVEEADVGYLIEEIPRAIDESIAGIGNIANIVKAMKEFSHPGGDEKVPMDLNRAIESVITVSSNEWKYAAELEKDLDGDLPLVPCHAQEFNQVILNLVVNAAHAIIDNNTDGSSKKGNIKISTKQLSNEVEVRIQDTGGGIPKEIRSNIFDPFFTTKEVGRGTGQGLSIAHAAVVDKMGGGLSFEVEDGVGTTFIIQLPLPAELGEASE